MGSVGLIEKIELVFRDPDLIPLLVQENYLNYKSRNTKGKSQILNLVVKVASAFSSGDIISGKITQLQRWELLPYALITGTVHPAALMIKKRDIFGLYVGKSYSICYTSWLRNSSYTSQRKKYFNDLHNRAMRGKNLSANRKEFITEYLSYLKDIMSMQIFIKKLK